MHKQHILNNNELNYSIILLISIVLLNNLVHFGVCSGPRFCNNGQTITLNGYGSWKDITACAVFSQDVNYYYSLTGYGATLYILSDAQYNDYKEQRNDVNSHSSTPSQSLYQISLKQSTPSVLEGSEWISSQDTVYLHFIAVSIGPSANVVVKMEMENAPKKGNTTGTVFGVLFGLIGIHAFLGMLISFSMLGHQKYFKDGHAAPMPDLDNLEREPMVVRPENMPEDHAPIIENHTHSESFNM